MVREDFPAVAARALEEGYDSPSLRTLAGLVEDTSEARSMFDRCLEELNITKPDTLRAVMRLVRETARGIVQAEVEPCQGAQAIWELTLLVDERMPELDTFVYAASEWPDRPEDSEMFKEAVVAAAREFVRTPNGIDR
jgi:hypothetical protein